MRRFGLPVLLLTLVILTGCAASADVDDNDISVVVTDFPCYDFARAVIGNSDNITLLIKPGMEVHSFDPTPNDVVAIMNADLFAYIGGESDVWVDGILDSIDNDAPATAKMFDCVTAIEEETVEGMQSGHDEHEHSGDTEYDEHIWTSPKNAVLMVRYIEQKLSEVDPANADMYSKNADKYVAEIENIDSQITDIVSSSKRTELVFGDRFPFLYFAREYGLTYYAAFPGCSSEAEPSAQTVMFLIDKVVKDNIPTVYEIELSSGNVAKTIADETGAEVMTMYSIQNVSADDFANGETYVSLMARNIEALKAGLN